MRFERSWAFGHAAGRVAKILPTRLGLFDVHRSPRCRFRSEKRDLPEPTFHSNGVKNREFATRRSARNRQVMGHRSRTLDGITGWTGSGPTLCDSILVDPVILSNTWPLLQIDFQFELVIQCGKQLVGRFFVALRSPTIHNDGEKFVVVEESRQ